MKANEFKLRFISGVNDMINTYFDNNSVIDKFINSTLKVMVNQKSYMIDDALELFTDKDGNINEEFLIEEYSKIFKDEKIIIDIRDFIKNDFIKSMLPDKALVVRIDDIIQMLK